MLEEHIGKILKVRWNIASIQAEAGQYVMLLGHRTINVKAPTETFLYHCYTLIFFGKVLTFYSIEPIDVWFEVIQDV